MALTAAVSDAPKTGKNTGTQSYSVPPTAVMPPVTRDPFIISGPSAPISSGGGGGGGGYSDAPVSRPSLDDYIKSNFLYTQTDNEGKRRLDDFDAEGLRLQQDTEAEQRNRRGTLQRDLADASQASSEGLAGRGLLRSGFLFQNQDKINSIGAEKENDIASLLTDLISGRQTSRRQLEASNRDALNQQIQKLTDQFNSQQQIA